MDKSPNVNFTLKEIFETLKSTGLLELTEDEFNELSKEDGFPISSEGKVNLIKLLAWTAIGSKTKRGESVK
jgi:hypothetical protein